MSENAIKPMRYLVADLVGAYAGVCHNSISLALRIRPHTNSMKANKEALAAHVLRSLHCLQARPRDALPNTQGFRKCLLPPRV